MYIKLSKDLSAKTYQDNKERLEEKSVKEIKVFLKKKKKKKRNNVAVYDTKIYQKKENKRWFSIKNGKMKKPLAIIVRNCFRL